MLHCRMDVWRIEKCDARFLEAIRHLFWTEFSGKLEALVGDYEPRNFAPIVSLLQRHGALQESSRVIQQYLRAAKEFAGVLRDTEARAGLMNLCEVLTAQTELLGGAA